MKRNIIALSLCVMAGIGSASAQSTQSGYFVDGYTYRYQMNPALGNDKNFVSMPGLGNLNLGLRGNLHLTNVLYNIDGKTTTFLNPGVSAQEVMSNLSDNNKLGLDVKVNILSAGFKAWGGYNTISLNARANAGIGLPKGIFSLLKEGISNRTYDISDLRATASAYAEIGLGHSRDIDDRLRVGATLKVLIGGGAVDAQLRDAHLDLGTDEWTITSDADIKTNLKGLKYQTKYDSHTDRTYVNGLDGSFNGITGFGLGLDLGATYRLNEDWSFSASVLDLGFISWSDTQLASTNGPQTFTTDKYTFNPDDDADNSFDKEWDRIRDDLSALYELEDMGSAGNRTQALNATLNFGAEYTFPLYRNLTFGLLNTTRIAGQFTWTDFRLSANVAPCKIFSAGVNMAAGTYGVGFGWLLNLHPTGFNLFLGMDHTFGKTAKQGVPLNSNASVNLGINFPF